MMRLRKIEENGAQTCRGRHQIEWRWIVELNWTLIWCWDLDLNGFGACVEGRGSLTTRELVDNEGHW